MSRDERQGGARRSRDDDSLLYRNHLSLGACCLLCYSSYLRGDAFDQKLIGAVLTPASQRHSMTVAIGRYSSHMAWLRCRRRMIRPRLMSGEYYQYVLQLPCRHTTKQRIISHKVLRNDRMFAFPGRLVTMRLS